MAAPSNTLRQHVQVCVGQKGTPIGSLIYTRQGRRESTAFAYAEDIRPPASQGRHLA